MSKRFVEVVNTTCVTGRKTGDTSTVSWTIQMKLNLVDMIGYEGNATLLYETFRHDLDDSVKSGNFTKTMKTVWHNEVGGTDPEINLNPNSSLLPLPLSLLRRIGDVAFTAENDKHLRMIVQDENELDVEVKAIEPELVQIEYPPSFMPTVVQTVQPVPAPIYLNLPTRPSNKTLIDPIIATKTEVTEYSFFVFILLMCLILVFVLFFYHKGIYYFMYAHCSYCWSLWNRRKYNIIPTSESTDDIRFQSCRSSPKQIEMSLRRLSEKSEKSNPLNEMKKTIAHYEHERFMMRDKIEHLLEKHSESINRN